MSEIDPFNLPAAIDVHTAVKLIDNENVLFIDVREQHEYDQEHIPGITHIPMSEVEGRESEFPKDKPIILTCRSGNRSGKVQAYLQKHFDYTNLHNMDGGILAWDQAGYEVEG